MAPGTFHLRKTIAPVATMLEAGVKEKFKGLIFSILRFKFYIRKRNGIKVYLSPDTYSLRLMFTSFKQNLHQGIERKKSFKTTYVDIGANVGWYSLCAAKVGYEKIIAVEANPKTYTSLINNISLNNLHSKILALNLAISDAPGVVEISDSNSSDQNTILKTEGSKIHTLSLSLDQIIGMVPIQGPAHLKVDIEGAEKLLIDGAKNVLGRTIFQTVEIESTFENFPYIENALEQHGYRLSEKADSKICINACFELSK